MGKRAYVGLVVATALAGGCAEESLPGERFTVTVQGTEDSCNEPMVQYAEAFEYRMVLRGSQATIYIGEALMAAGTLVGCDLTYSSPPFTDERGDGQYVRWSIDGEAALSYGGSGCGGESGWVGTEAIRILESTDPDVPRGCTYQTTTEGTWLGSGEG